MYSIGQKDSFLKNTENRLREPAKELHLEAYEERIVRLAQKPEPFGTVLSTMEEHKELPLGVHWTTTIN